MPILSELTLQLKNTLIDLPNLLRQFNEVDRERKGVLTRKQVRGGSLEGALHNHFQYSTGALPRPLYACV